MQLSKEIGKKPLEEITQKQITEICNKKYSEDFVIIIYQRNKEIIYQEATPS